MVTPANKRSRQMPTLETRRKPCVQRTFHLPFGAIALNSTQRRAWPPRLPTPTATTASRRRQSQVTRIICLGRPRHHRQFGDPGQQTPTTSAHPGDTGTTLRPAHVTSSFRSHRTQLGSAESMAASLNNTYHYHFQPQETIPSDSDHLSGSATASPTVW